MARDVIITDNVNGVDINYSLRDDFGGFILRNGCNDLLEFPETKSVRTVSYAEVDYDIADLSDLKLASKSITLSLFFNDEAKYKSFLEMLKENVYHQFAFQLLSMSKNLRFVGVKSCTYSGEDFIEASLEFYEDVPTVVLSTPKAYPGIGFHDGFSYSLDGESFLKYGIVMLKGTHQEFLKLHELKDGLKVDLSTIDGVEYDADAMRTNNADSFTMHCFMRAVDMQTAVGNLNSLLYSLVKRVPNNGINACRRKVTSYKLGKTFNCYYKSMKITRFFPDPSRIWIEFDLTMKLVN